MCLMEELATAEHARDSEKSLELDSDRERSCEDVSGTEGAVAILALPDVDMWLSNFEICSP